MNYITEAFKLLEDDEDNIPLDSKNSLVTTKPNNKALVDVDNDLNARLITKIEKLSVALASALEREGLGKSLDPELIKQDMIRDCGLMGDIISTNELDVENNPFDAATKQMHDMGPVDTKMACDTLLNVPVEEFVNRIIMGLKHERGLLPGGMRGLPGPRDRRALPPNNNFRRIR